MLKNVTVNQLKFLHKNSKNFLKFHNQYDKQNIYSGLPFYSWVTERHSLGEFSNCCNEKLGGGARE